jgi:phosphomannomutase/phosphoglucomutase
MGVSVRDVGQVPTPVVHFAARRFGCPHVVIATASHNPGTYNGVKFMVGGRPAVPELMTELEAGLDAEPLPSTSATSEQYDPTSDYAAWVIQATRSLVAVPSAPNDAAEPGVAQQSLSVIVDSMGGACTHLAPDVLRTIGCDVVSLVEKIDPDFATRTPNPGHEAHIEELRLCVPRETADLGLAFDGDGDRVILVDHTGRVVPPEQVAAVLVSRCFRTSRVVYDQKCASLVPRVVRDVGGTPIMRPSGYGFIKTTMIDTEAATGVEASGHHFFAALGGGDDGLFTALLVLEIMRQSDATLARLVAPFPWPTITSDLRIPLTGEANLLLETIASTCGGTVTRLDGVRADYEDGWALARASITEPAMTFRFEAVDADRLQTVVERFLAGQPDLRKRVLESIHD